VNVTPFVFAWNLIANELPDEGVVYATVTTTDSLAFNAPNEHESGPDTAHVLARLDVRKTGTSARSVTRKSEEMLLGPAFAIVTRYPAAAPGVTVAAFTAPGSLA
jgi:hypothetical protein